MKEQFTKKLWENTPGNVEGVGVCVGWFVACMYMLTHCICTCTMCAGAIYKAIIFIIIHNYIHICMLYC